MRRSPAGRQDSTPKGARKSTPAGGGIRVLLLLNRRERRALERALRRCRDAPFAKRCMIVLQRSRGWSYRRIAEVTGVALGTVPRVLRRWKESGLLGLIDRREDNGSIKADDRFLGALWQVLEGTPADYGWSRPTWTIEMLVRTLARKTGVWVSRSTISRALARIGARKGRPKPIVLCPWSKARRTRRLNQIHRLIAQAGPRDVVLWADEVDIHLNPRIGPDWMLPGRQRKVLTPGRNEKRYLAGAMHARTGRLTWVSGERKTSRLFIELILALCRQYRRARVIHLVVDNWKVHDSRQTRQVLAELGGRVRLHFLPPYSPDDNPIERVWKDFHDNVTRNHRYRRMGWLMQAAEGYLQLRNAVLGGRGMLGCHAA